MAALRNNCATRDKKTNFICRDVKDNIQKEFDEFSDYETPITGFKVYENLNNGQTKTSRQLLVLKEPDFQSIEINFKPIDKNDDDNLEKCQILWNLIATKLENIEISSPMNVNELFLRDYCVNGLTNDEIGDEDRHQEGNEVKYNDLTKIS